MCFYLYNIFRKITRKVVMNKVFYYIRRFKIIIILFLILIFLCINIMSNINDKNEKNDVEIFEQNDEVVTEETTDKKMYVVDVKGMVLNPGVYEIDKDSRVLEAINAAGGVIEGANTEYLNLSKKIKDEMVIIVYSNEEIEKIKEENEKIVYIEKECTCPDSINDACIDKSMETGNNKLISINSATLDELMTLPGIGKSKANSIIDYREKNGNFKTLEDIMNVSGIGEDVYSKIKDYIKL